MYVINLIISLLQEWNAKAVNIGSYMLIDVDSYIIRNRQ